MSDTNARCLLSLLLATLLPLTASAIGLGQHQTKLVGDGSVGTGQQGLAVAISRDGNTAIVGAPYDNTNAGAAWIYVRNGNVWSQQGPKLIGSGASASALQGASVALSADGDTAIIGGFNDNAGVGAAWVFARSGGVWSQQGAKLVGTGAVGVSGQGLSVALSADGNTAMVGGYNDNAAAGAAWVYTRSIGTWSQQGNKLVGTGAANPARQGTSVALAADGNTAIVGGYSDNAGAGAAWVFTRSGAAWSQQGSKLVGTGAGGAANGGTSVALSASGDTALSGGNTDNANAGATWVFVRTAGTWSQQGPKLLGSGAIGAAQQGTSIALSADGNMAIVGGYRDNAFLGAVWPFVRTGEVWSQAGTKLVGSLKLGNSVRQGIAVSLSADGRTAISGASGDNTDIGAAWILAGPPCTLDIDGDNDIDAATDGLLIIRAMLGLTGTSVTNNAVGANAARNDWGKLQAYLNGNCGTAFAQ